MEKVSARSVGTLLRDLGLVDEAIPLPYTKLVSVLKFKQLNLASINDYIFNVLGLPPVKDIWFERLHASKFPRYKQAMRASSFIFTDYALRRAFLALSTAGFSVEETYDILKSVSRNFASAIDLRTFKAISTLYWDASVFKNPTVWSLFVDYAKGFMPADELAILQQAYTGFDFVGLTYSLGLPVFGASDPRRNAETILSWVIGIVTKKIRDSKNANEINKLWNVIQDALKLLSSYTEGEDLVEKLTKLRIPLRMETPKFEVKQTSGTAKPSVVKRKPTAAKPKPSPDDPLGFIQRGGVPRPTKTGVLAPPDIYDDDIPESPY